MAVARYDPTYLLFFILAAVALPFLFVQAQDYTGGFINDPYTFGVLVSLVFILMGFAGTQLNNKFSKGSDIAPPFDHASEILQGSMVIVALVGFVLFNAYLPQIKLQALQTVQIVTTYGVFNLSISGEIALAGAFFFTAFLIPVAEESFFRGFLLNVFVPDGAGSEFILFGLLIQAGLFTIFHIPVYGFNAADLEIIFAAGFTIGGIDVVTGRVSTGVIAHSLNNALAFVAVSGLIVFPFPLVVGGVSSGLLLGLGIYIATYAIVTVRKSRGKEFDRMAINFRGPRWSR